MADFGIGEAIMIASAVTAATAGTVGGVMSYRQGKAAKASAEAQAEELRRAAKRSEQQAAVEQVKGDQEQQKRMMLLASDIGSAYAGFAGNGLLVDGGGAGEGSDTVGSVIRSTAREGQFDISTIKDNAAMNVWTYQSQAASQRAQANAAIAEGKAAYKNGRLGLLSGVLTGVAQAGSMAGMGFKAGPSQKVMTAEKASTFTETKPTQFKLQTGNSTSWGPWGGGGGTAFA